jgi:hypothetical protein
VVLVTRINTRFNVDAAFFARLSSAHYSVEREATRGIRTVRERASEPIPDAVVSRLRSLQGRSFASATEFVAAASSAITPAAEREMESPLLASARSDQYYWIAVVLMACAAAGHQAWSANLFTVVSDVFPKSATASLVGLGGFFGAVAGLVSDWSLGEVLARSGPAGYLFAFLVAGSLYLVLFGVLQILMPTMTPLDENLRPISAEPNAS